MFLKHSEIAPARASAILGAAEAAARAIPPAFPLEATAAVNPFLGQAGEDLTAASARFARVAGVRVTPLRAQVRAEVQAGQICDDDLAAALIASDHPLKPVDLGRLKAKLGTETPEPVALPTVADLAMRATGTDWPGVVAKCFGLWAGGHFDRGQALWTPAPGRGAFVAWRDWAMHDLTPEIAGLAGFCAHVSGAPDTAERAILRAADALGLTGAAAETAFHRLLMDLGGWAQHARFLLWQAEKKGGSDASLIDLLAIRLIWEEALLAHVPEVADDWARTVPAHAVPLAPTPDQAADAIAQDAAERAHQRCLSGKLARGGAATRLVPPALQAAFCIDVRSEPFRRALEAQDQGIATLGFAGFFGLPARHRAQGSDMADDHLPVLLSPGLEATSQPAREAEAAARIAARASRAWGRFRQAAVSSFAFVESAGPLYVWKLFRDALALNSAATAKAPKPRFEPALSPAAKAETAERILRAMGLTQGHARLVLLLGHGAQITNNPHESSYHCGACGGHTGEVSARLLADLLNDPDTRAGLPARGVEVPEDTVFMAGLHDTTTDQVTLFDDTPMSDHAQDVERARIWLSAAGAVARAERAPRLPGAHPGRLATRAANWAEVRPEWGLAGCSSFIAAPRDVTAGADLGGRVFLHDYDWRADAQFATLEMILTAPVVVASWIALQYYGSSVAPTVFGGGNKLIHNVTGGIGVVQGNGGILRPGLPWQAVHDGERPVHRAMRLSVLVEAPRHAVDAVLADHDELRKLVDNGWLHLLLLDAGRVTARYRPGRGWSPPDP